MPNVFISDKRGNDNNPGTKSQPWASSQKVHGQSFGADSHVLYASDHDEFRIATQANSGHVNMDNVRSTNPLLPVIISYYEPAGSGSDRPTFALYYTPAANEWAWDETWNAWKYIFPTGIYPSPDTSVFFGPARLHGTSVWQDHQLNPLFGDLQWGTNTNYGSIREIYVYAPPDEDPTTYYGEIRLCPNARGFFQTAWQGMQNTLFEGIAFKEGGTGIVVSVSGGAGAHTGLRLKYCRGERAPLFSMYSGESAAHQFSTYKCEGYDLPSGLIKGGQNAGTYSYTIDGTYIDGCNKQKSAMAGVYMQTACANMWDGVVKHSHIKNAWNGTGTELGAGYGCPFDGCGIYFDLGADKNVAYANLVEHSHVGYQTNSCKQVLLIANVALDCNLFSTSTDAGAVGSNDVAIINNSYLNRLTSVNDVKHGVTTPLYAAISNWYEVTTSSFITVVNNALYRQYIDDGISETIRVERNATSLVEGNAVSGWSAAMKAIRNAYSGTPSGKLDITSTAISVIGSGDTYFKNEACLIASPSPLKGAGKLYQQGQRDKRGYLYGVPASIGAYEFDALNTYDGFLI